MNMTKHYSTIILSALLAVSPLMGMAQEQNEQTLFPRKFVVEKATGIWCPHCPWGIAGFEKLAAAYPDVFIGISAHRDDALHCATYRFFDAWGAGGIPTSMVNRKENRVYPSFGVLNDKYVSYYSEPVPAKVETTIVKKDAANYVLETSVTLGYSTTEANYNVAYVIVEDKLGPYKQKNALSGDQEDMGGWGKLPYYVETMYDNVAREVLPNITGQGNPIPTTMERDVPAQMSYRVEPGSYVKNVENAKVVTLLLNAETGEIVNADLKPFAGVTSVAMPGLKENADAAQKTYDLFGRKVVQPQKGLYIVDGKKVMR